MGEFSELIFNQKQIDIELNSSNGASASPLVVVPGTASALDLDPELYSVLPLGKTILSLDFVAEITSVPLVPAPPDEGAFDTQIEASIARRDWLWKNPRKQLNILIRKSTSSPWRFLGAFSLIRVEPYFRLSILGLIGEEYKLENGAELGIQIKDVGNGLLNGGDRITLTGSYYESLQIVKKVLLSGSGGTETGGSSGGSTVDLSQILNFSKLANNLPIDIPDWANWCVWDVSSSWLSFGSNPGIATCLYNPIYKNYQYVSSNYYNAWLQIDFKAAFLVTKVGFNMGFGANYSSDSMDIQIGDNGTSWTNILTGAPQATEILINTNTTKARYLRITNKDSSIPSGWIIDQLKIFGNY